MNQTFYDKYVIGEAKLDDIYDYITEWHLGDSKLELHEYLGLTEEQYAHWMQYETLDKN